MDKISLFILLVLCSSAAVASTPSCLGGACIDKKQLTEADITQKFGSSYFKSVSKYDKSSSFCFQLESRDGRYYLEITTGDPNQFNNFSKIKYSSATICKSNKNSHLEEKLKTTEGITLGSRIEDLQKIYGVPTWTMTPPKKPYIDDFFGAKSKYEVDSIILYAAKKDESLFSFFYLSKGIIVGIEMTTQP